jgi:hypothetical protein
VKANTVHVESFRLTEPQVGMLLFFAGELDSPCAEIGTTNALIIRGFLELNPANGRYEINDRGRQVVAGLDRQAFSESLLSRLETSRGRRLRRRPRSRRS